MFGSLKKLFGREETPPPPPTSPAPAKDTKPARPVGSPPAARSSVPATAPTEPAAPEEQITLSFNAVAKNFPPNVASSVVSHANEITVPLKKVLSLLPTGS